MGLNKFSLLQLCSSLLNLFIIGIIIPFLLLNHIDTNTPRIKENQNLRQQMSTYLQYNFIYQRKATRPLSE